MLDLQGIFTKYGDLRILQGVSATVERGRFVSIVGANGAGKTTLMNTISGLVRPTEGDISWEGVNISSLPSHERAKLGIIQVPEGRKLFPMMTVYENLLVASVCWKSLRKNNLDLAFSIFPRLKERVNQVAITLSGGEQQMLAIARGIMCSPKILMLDEPSLGLAPILVQEIFSIIKKLNQEGLTILLIEQNVKTSLKLSDYAYVLENGRIALEGRGAELVESEHTKRAYLGM